MVRTPAVADVPAPGAVGEALKLLRQVHISISTSKVKSFFSFGRCVPIFPKLPFDASIWSFCAQNRKNLAIKFPVGNNLGSAPSNSRPIFLAKLSLFAIDWRILAHKLIKMLSKSVTKSLDAQLFRDLHSMASKVLARKRI